jgi:ATP-dependent Clp protease ATP-binding subunit ClpB
VYGARPVKRALQRELQTLLAQALLRGEFAEGDTILVEAAADASCLTLHKVMPDGQQAQQLLLSSPQQNGQPSQPSQQQQPRANGINGAPAAAANGVAAGAAANGSAPGAAAAAGPPSGKKKVVRLVRKTKSSKEGAEGSSIGGKANGAVSRTSSSGGLQSMPISFGDSEDADH